MNSRVIDYIKKYLHVGHSLDEIRQSLLKEGIAEDEIKQSALLAMEEGTVEIKKKHNYLVWVIVPLIIAFLIATYFVFQDSIKPITEKEISFDITQEQTGKCDINCLIRSANMCTPRTTTHTTIMNFFGIVITKETLYEIRKGEKCELYIQSISNKVEFTEELKQQSLANGISEGEIEVQVSTSNSDIQKLNNKDAVCIFKDNSDLKEFLEKIRDDAFIGTCTTGKCVNDADWKIGECTGSMFNG